MIQTKHNILKTLLFLSISFFITACSDSNVEAVKNGTFNEFPQGNIGPVFESYFTDTTWDSSEKAGKKYVSFKGKISEEVKRKYVEKFSRRFEVPSGSFKSDNTIIQNYQAEIEALYKERVEADKKLKQEGAELHTKFRSQGGFREANGALKPEVQSHNDKVDKHNKSFQDKLQNLNDKWNQTYMKSVLKVGEEVHFKWRVQPDGSLEVVEFGSETWGNQRWNLDDVLRPIFSE